MKATRIDPAVQELAVLSGLRQGLPVRLDRAPQRGAAFALTSASWLKAMAEKRGAKTEVKPSNLYQGCVFAWNAYREGKTISTIKFDTKKGLYAASE